MKSWPVCQRWILILMISLDSASLFVAASILLAMVPGPDNLFVMMLSAMHGMRSGLVVVAGLCSGLLIHTSAAALGVSVIFQTSALAFSLLKLFGAGYLLYLAWQAWQESVRVQARRDADWHQQDDAMSSFQLYLRGLVMNVTNPKVTLFFLAFLPQFVEPGQGAVPVQMTQLGILFIASSILVFTGIAWFSGRIGGWLQSSVKAQVWLNRSASLVFLSLAVKLLLAKA